MLTDNKVNKPFIGIYLLDGTDDGVKLAVTKKPNFFRKILLKILFGWVWSDVKK